MHGIDVVYGINAVHDIHDFFHVIHGLRIMYDVDYHARRSI
jgi:hypothetical protein